MCYYSYEHDIWSWLDNDASYYTALQCYLRDNFYDTDLVSWVEFRDTYLIPCFGAYTPDNEPWALADETIMDERMRMYAVE
jgi:hypothetical protein